MKMQKIEIHDNLWWTKGNTQYIDIPSNIDKEVCYQVVRDKSTGKMSLFVIHAWESAHRRAVRGIPESVYEEYLSLMKTFNTEEQIIPMETEECHDLYSKRFGEIYKYIQNKKKQ